MFDLTSSKALFAKIASIIETSRRTAYTAINIEMVLMYWNIGEAIKSDILGNEKAEYGKAMLAELGKHLTLQYGRGFSERNIFNMLKFYEVFNNKQILQTLSAKLSWSHFCKLMYIEDDTQRDFYMTMAINERWSVRTLNERINSMLFERTLISKKPEGTIARDLRNLRNNKEMSTDLFFRDPYLFDFLNLADIYGEKDLENAILHELERFILEMGRDFAFLGRQVRIPINDKDYYIDLPIAIIRCAKKDDAIVELLELDKSGIHVGQCYTELPPKSVWQDKLRKAITNAKQLIEQRNSDA